MIIPSAVKGKTVCVHTRQGDAVMTTDHYHYECGGLFVRIHVSRVIYRFKDSVQGCFKSGSGHVSSCSVSLRWVPGGYVEGPGPGPSKTP